MHELVKHDGLFLSSCINVYILIEKKKINKIIKYLVDTIEAGLYR